MKRKLREDNRGMSLVMVVSVVAIVTILVSITLALALFNYRMKITNKNSKDNFYDAEQVLDEIRLGLQQDISDAMSNAYFQTMEKYADTELEEAAEYFKQCYTQTLRTTLAVSNNKSYYDMEHLRDFLNEDVKKRTTLETADGKSPFLNINTDKGVTLKNIALTYVNDKKYVSKIETDIQIKIPDMNFSKFNTGSNVVQYALVGQEGITLKNGSIILDGSAYAGSSYNEASLTVLNGADISVSSGNDLVINDTLDVQQGGHLSLENKSVLWANDIEASSASDLQLWGTTYVANDLTLAGGANVTIGGQYYGFGNPKAALQAVSVKEHMKEEQIKNTPADYSSAIIVNALGVGGKAKLNLKNIHMLMLAGNAYIGDSKVLMGESLTVKSNQIAYLVPESCMPDVPNPMTAQMRSGKLSTIEGADEKEKEQNFKKQILTKVQAEVSADVIEIVQMLSADGVYYYYMQFEDAKAADRYFAKHYQSAASDKIKKYLQYYVEDQEVKINADAKKESNGNLLLYDENGISAIGDSIAEGQKDLSEDRETINQLVSYQDIFHALNTNLSMDYASLTDTQKEKKKVYQNLFDTEEYDRLFRKESAENKKKAYFVYDDGQEKYAAYYTQEENESTDEILDQAKQRGYTLKMIISEHDVSVKGEFDGLLLCGGRIEVCGGSTVTNAPAVVTKLIHHAKRVTYREAKEQEYTLKEFMNDPDKYAGNFYEAEDREDNKIHLEDLVVYVNWSKQ